jgi:hypothetical protein
VRHNLMPGRTVFVLVAVYHRTSAALTAADDGLRPLTLTAIEKSDTEDLSVAAALLAVADNAPGAIAEVVHLTGGSISTLTMTPLVLGRRRDALAIAIERVRAGDFPTKPTQRVCPRCPAFFVCGPVPAGTLRKEF